jgi:hypothetical protein
MLAKCVIRIFPKEGLTHIIALKGSWCKTPLFAGECSFQKKKEIFT